MHDTLAPLTPLWLKALAASLLVIAALVLAGVRIGNRSRGRLAVILGIFLLASELLIHPYIASRGLWKIDTCLPLHLCDLTAIFAWVALLWRNQKVYECLFFWGIPGAIISLATPEFTLAPGVINADGTLGGETLVFLHYYVSHGGILVAALYLTFALGMKPRRGSWWKISLLGQPMLLAIGMINWILGTNYVFLCEPPLVANPLIIGGWPWYVLGMIILMVVASLILYLPFGLKYHGNTTRGD